jgi:DNA-binding MarR family transcriptional regulator
MNTKAPISSCVSYNLRKASRIISKLYAQQMRPAPIRGPQFSLMMMIARQDSPAISELSRDIGADRTTMTRNLDQLAKRGFIRVVQGKDLRTKAVEVTPKGKAALDRSIAYWQKAQARTVKVLGQERWNRMLEDLSVLSNLAVRRS